MLRNWGRSLFNSAAHAASCRGRPVHAPRQRFRPRLELLEKRECPTVNLSAGTNLNLSQATDNQADETIAIDPSTSTVQNLFVAGSTWHGDTEGTIGNGTLLASHSSDGGATWSRRQMASGVDGGDALPAAIGGPHAAFDSFGNLFLVYGAAHNEYSGASTSVGSTTLTDANANWAPNEWANQQVKITSGADLNDVETILSNTATTVTVASWHVTPDAQSGFYVTLPGTVNTEPVLAMSTDHGQTFTWLKTWSLSSGPSNPFVPLVATGPGSTSGQGSVWALWYNSMGQPSVSGAAVTGLGQVGGFITPESPSTTQGLLAPTGLAVGPGGQMLITWQTNLLSMPPQPPKAKVYTAVDADGLGTSGFSTPVVATTTYVGLGYTLPAMGTWHVNAGAALAYDRSGGTHNGRVYLVYTDAASSGSNDTNIFAIHSDDNGSTWSSPVSVNDDTTSNSQFFPEAAVDQTTGNLAVTWYDARDDSGNTAVRLYGTVSTDGGGTFAANVPVSAGQTNGTQTGTESQGTASDVSATALTDPSQHWASNWWQSTTSVNPPAKTYLVKIISGAYSGDQAVIVGNTATTLTVDDTTWSSGPPSDSNVQYIIVNPYGDSVGDYTGLDYRAGKFFAAWADNSNSTQDNPDSQEYTLDVYVAPVTVTVSPGGGGGGLAPAGNQPPAVPPGPIAPAALGAPLTSADVALAAPPQAAPTGPALPAPTPATGGQGPAALFPAAPLGRMPRSGRNSADGVPQDESPDLWTA